MLVNQVHLASEWYVWVSQTGMSELRFADESIILWRLSLETLHDSVSQRRKVKILKNAKSPVAFSLPSKALGTKYKKTLQQFGINTKYISTLLEIRICYTGAKCWDTFKLHNPTEIVT